MCQLRPHIDILSSYSSTSSISISIFISISTESLGDNGQSPIIKIAGLEDIADVRLEDDCEDNDFSLSFSSFNDSLTDEPSQMRHINDLSFDTNSSLAEDHSIPEPSTQSSSPTLYTSYIQALQLEIFTLRRQLIFREADRYSALQDASRAMSMLYEDVERSETDLAECKRNLVESNKKVPHFFLFL